MFYSSLPEPVASLLKKVKSFPLPPGTYLAGGTAATIYYGHRLSVDIDLFTNEGFFTGPIVETLRNNHKFVSEQVSEKDTLLGEIAGVRFSIFKYPYPLLEPLRHDPHFDLDLASPLDIAAMKTVAITQRGTAKDFVDLQAILSNQNFPLEELIRQTLKKYGVSEDYGYHIRKGLVYFDDAEKGKGTVTLIKNGQPAQMSEENWEQTRDFFRRLVLPT